MEKSTRSSLDRYNNGPSQIILLQSTKSDTPTTASIRRSSNENTPDKSPSLHEPEREDEVDWSKLIIVVVALILSIFMVSAPWHPPVAS